MNIRDPMAECGLKGARTWALDRLIALRWDLPEGGVVEVVASSSRS